MADDFVSGKEKKGSCHRLPLSGIAGTSYLSCEALVEPFPPGSCGSMDLRKAASWFEKKSLSP